MIYTAYDLGLFSKDFKNSRDCDNINKILGTNSLIKESWYPSILTLVIVFCGVVWPYDLVTYLIKRAWK